MNAIIGKVTTTQASILHGDHHIVLAGTFAEGLTDLKAGMLLKLTVSGAGEYTPVLDTVEGADADEACAVLLEDVADVAEVDVESVAVHGVVRKEKLLIADGVTAPSAAAIAALAARGIYAA